LFAVLFSHLLEVALLGFVDLHVGLGKISAASPG
jgi:hypothetical protein